MHRMPEVSKIATAFHKKADRYDQNVLVQKRVVAQLAESIKQHISQPPESILDVGTGTGALLELLHSQYPAVRLAGVDIAPNMCLRAQQKLGDACHIVNGNAEALPFKSGTFDLIVSASVLQWVSNLTVAISEMRRVVRPGGEISIAFFCHGSLSELHHCFKEAASQLGAAGYSQKASRLHAFWTVDDVKAIVNEMDFERVVLTVETETDWYDDLHTLLKSIKNIGAGTVSGSSANGLGWRGLLQEASRLYQKFYGQNGRIPATYKVLYLTARTKLHPADN